MAGALNRYGRQVAPHPPQIASFPESRIDSQFLLVAIVHVIRHGLEIVDVGQIHFRMPVIDGWIDGHRAQFGADKVVLLGVAMEQRAGTREMSVSTCRITSGGTFPESMARFKPGRSRRST
jgi:hypothetical protein